jgi:hypothetical protein
LLRPLLAVVVLVVVAVNRKPLGEREPQDKVVQVETA